jgi:hypothetical protein
MHSSKRTAWVLAASLLVGAAASLADFSTAEAATKPKSTAPKIDARILKPLQAANEFAKAGKFAEAEAELQTADAVPEKTPFEQFQIDELKCFVLIKQKKYDAGARACDASLQSGLLPPENVNDRLRLLAQLFPQTEPREMTKSGDYARRWLEATGTRDPLMLFLVAQAAYFTDNLGEAAKYAQEAVSASVAAGSKPDENWLRVLQSAQSKLKNEPGIMAATTELVRYYPSKEYWSTLFRGLLGQAAGKERQILQVFRLMYAVDAMDEADDFTEAATVANQLGSPGEALKYMEKGYATGVLEKSGDKAKSQALLADSRRVAAADQKALPQFEKEAQAAKAGEADVKLGEAFLSYDQPAKGLEAIQRGIAKGGVKNLDEANLSLARALMAGAKIPEARQALEQVKGPEYAQLAQLWSIHAGQL